MKKIMVLFSLLLLVGCTTAGEVKVVKKSHGESKTYQFFKDFDVNHYYVSFLDRNTSINDDSKIIFAKNGDKYYYEMDGYERQIVVWKDGISYTVNPSREEYYKEESEVQDLSVGILPRDIQNLKSSGYQTGREEIYNKKYNFEKFVDGPLETTYYYDGEDLVYVKFKDIQKQVLLKFVEMKSDFSDEIFDINPEYLEISY